MNEEFISTHAYSFKAPSSANRMACPTHKSWRASKNSCVKRYTHQSCEPTKGKSKVCHSSFKF